MYLNKMRLNKHHNSQRGSALVIAVFIIVIMTLLGAALVRMMSSNAETVVYEVLGIRAYQAAHAGMQRELAEIFPLAPAGSVCNPSSNYDFSAIKGLENCEATNVTCSESIILSSTYYTIKSIGQCDVAGVLTSREIEVRAKRL